MLNIKSYLQWLNKKSIQRLALFMFVLLFISRVAHNKFVDKEHLMEIAHGRVLVEVKRRLDVTTQCMDAVDRYRAIEERIQKHLVTLNSLTKSHSGNAAKQKEQNAIVALVKELDLLKEKYPDLKAMNPSAFLMQIIQDAGARVTNARYAYNTSVYDYNVFCMTFPYKIFSWFYGFGEQRFFARATGDPNRLPLFE